MFAEKSWGSYRVLDVDNDCTTVKVTLNPGHRMNYHSHERRDEVWTVQTGSGEGLIRYEMSHIIVDVGRIEGILFEK